MKKIILPLLVIIIFSCRKEEPVETITTNQNNTSTPVLTAQSNPQFHGTINGQLISITTAPASQYHSSQIGTGGQSSEFEWGCGLIDTNIFQSIVELKKGILTLPAGGNSTVSDFFNFLPLGMYSFSRDFRNQTGVSFEYIDSTGKVWSTAFGNGDQTGSIIEMTDRHELSVNGNAFVYAKFEINCTLYDSFGASQQLTDGVLISYFRHV